MADKKVVVFTMTGCPHCAAVKEFLKEKGVEFAERNVLDDDQAMADFRELGFRGTPVTLIGEEPVVGFDKDRLEELLGA